MHKLFFENLQPETLVFGRFELIRCLSAGHVAGVYLCFDKLHNNRKVVLKIISTSVNLGAETVKSLREEMRISQQIRHENVLSAKEFFADPSFVAFTLDYIDGGTLADVLASKIRISFEEIFNILEQLCLGLDAIHKSGVVHRDIKPENILIDNSGKIKISDFGIAAQMHTPGMSANDELTGSINYLSPEYIEYGKFDVRSDVFALGVVGYELATGKLPFHGGNLLETLTRRVRHDPPPPWQIRAGVPDSLSSVVMRAMQRRPEFRFQDAHEMLRAVRLARVTQKSGVTSKFNPSPLSTLNHIDLTDHKI